MDYPIPANLNSLRFHHTLAHLLVRAVREGTDLRAELKRYRRALSESYIMKVT